MADDVNITGIDKQTWNEANQTSNMTGTIHEEIRDVLKAIEKLNSNTGIKIKEIASSDAEKESAKILKELLDHAKRNTAAAAGSTDTTQAATDQTQRDVNRAREGAGGPTPAPPTPRARGADSPQTNDDDDPFKTLSDASDKVARDLGSVFTTAVDRSIDSLRELRGIGPTGSSYQQVLESAKAVTADLGDEMNTTKNPMRRLGAATMAAADAISFIAGFGFGYLLDAISKTTESFNAITKSGVFSNIDDFADAAGDANLTLEQFTDVIKSAGPTISDMGVEAFGETARELERINRDFGYLGMTMQEQAETIADLNKQSRLSMTFQTMNAQEQAKFTQHYLKNLADLSELTGKQADELKAEQEATKLNTAFQLKLQELRRSGNDEEAAFLEKRAADMAAMGQGDEFLSKVIYGTAAHAEGYAEQMAMTGGALQAFHESMLDPTKTLDDFAGMIENAGENTISNASLFAKAGAVSEETAKKVAEFGRVALKQAQLMEEQGGARLTDRLQNELNEATTNQIEMQRDLIKALNQLQTELHKLASGVMGAIGAFGTLAAVGGLAALPRLIRGLRGLIGGGRDDGLGVGGIRRGMTQALNHVLGPFRRSPSLGTTQDKMMPRYERQLFRIMRRAMRGMRMGRGMGGGFGGGADRDRDTGRPRGRFGRAMGAVGRGLGNLGRGAMAFGGMALGGFLPTPDILGGGAAGGIGAAGGTGAAGAAAGGAARGGAIGRAAGAVGRGAMTGLRVGARAIPFVGQALMIADAGRGIIEGWSEAGNYFETEAPTLSQKISGSVGGALETLSFGLIDAKGTANLLHDTGKKVGDLAKGAISLVSDGISQGKEIVSGAANWIGEKGSGIWGSITSLFSSDGGKEVEIDEKSKEMGQKINEFMVGSLGKSIELISDAMNTSSITRSVTAPFTRMGERSTDLIRESAEQIQTALDYMDDELDDEIEKRWIRLTQSKINDIRDINGPANRGSGENERMRLLTDELNNFAQTTQDMLITLKQSNQVQNNSYEILKKMYDAELATIQAQNRQTQEIRRSNSRLSAATEASRVVQ